jgi:hypothetical protein
MSELLHLSDCTVGRVDDNSGFVLTEELVDRILRQSGAYWRAAYLLPNLLGSAFGWRPSLALLGVALTRTKTAAIRTCISSCTSR